MNGKAIDAKEKLRQDGLYDAAFEHDNCGIGAIIHVKGEKSHQLVDDALKIVERLEHRAGKDATGETGDGVGILTQIPHTFFAKVLVRCGYVLSAPGRSAGPPRKENV